MHGTMSLKKITSNMFGGRCLNQWIRYRQNKT